MGLCLIFGYTVQILIALGCAGLSFNTFAAVTQSDL